MATTTNGSRARDLSAARWVFSFMHLLLRRKRENEWSFKGKRGLDTSVSPSLRFASPRALSGAIERPRGQLARLGRLVEEEFSKMAFSLSDERERELSKIVARYPNKMAACIPVLHLCQEANGNWVSDDVIEFVAQKLELGAAHVKGVVTFYTLFNQSPPGRHQVWVCRTLSCALRGSGELIEHCEKKLGVHLGETTKNGKVTLRTAECLASCGTAPVMQVDRTYYENLTTEAVDRILDRLMNE
jgi:NADH-quinone oxidoreductase subunit E